MQFISKFRRVVPFIALCALVAMTSCNGSKKYGCPNHLFTPTLVR